MKNAKYDLFLLVPCSKKGFLVEPGATATIDSCVQGSLTMVSAQVKEEPESSISNPTIKISFKVTGEVAEKDYFSNR